MPKLGDRQEEVLKVIYQADKSLTDKEISNKLNRPINTVTPRRNELVKKGLVIEDERRKCTITGRKAIAWKVRKPVKSKIAQRWRS